MTEYIIAYKRHSIQWTKISGGYSLLSEARQVADKLQADYPNSALGIFAIHENETDDWRERKPRYIFNEAALVGAAGPRAALGGLVGSLGSDWF